MIWEFTERLKNFNIMGVHWKIRFLRGGGGEGGEVHQKKFFGGGGGGAGDESAKKVGLDSLQI